ncbi:hypothetical protein AG1IA_01968 [Rhizoctonia solani AG-1 IA]|uniref:Uncharacterized protein n=1 Tax=Thanatephorus cucumeris (strain AG1-IA) TaxID=983506 RepID=L8X4F0_THACA|nr:hypothetical protein AG1IA_01968 [Rhizoctonia solani AG-1 IA]
MVTIVYVWRTVTRFIHIRCIVLPQTDGAIGGSHVLTSYKGNIRTRDHRGDDPWCLATIFYCFSTLACSWLSTTTSPDYLNLWAPLGYCCLCGGYLIDICYSLNTSRLSLHLDDDLLDQARQQVHPIQQPHAPRPAVTTPHVLGANPYHTGTRPIPLRRETHVKSLTGQPLRGRWELDTSESPLAHAAAHPSKTLKVLCKNDADLQLECQGKALLEARIQITGRGWLHPQIEHIPHVFRPTKLTSPEFQARHGSQRFRLTARTLGGNLVIRIPSDFRGRVVASVPNSVTFSPNAAKLLNGPRTTTVGPNGTVAEYSTGLPSAEEGADGRHSRFLDLIHVSPGGGSVRVLVGDEGLLRASGLVAGVLVAKQRAEDELARRRSHRYRATDVTTTLPFALRVIILSYALRTSSNECTESTRGRSCPTRVVNISDEVRKTLYQLAKVPNAHSLMVPGYTAQPTRPQSSLNQVPYSTRELTELVHARARANEFATRSKVCRATKE